MKRHEKLVVGLLLFWVSLYYGCSTELQHGLTEDQANDVLVVLQQNDIPAAAKIREEGEKPLWTIAVPKSDSIRAWRLMKSQDLPRAPEKGFAETFGNNSLIPTATEEKALYMDALCNELQKTIETVDGVVKARVHLVLAEEQILPEEATPENRPKASVLIKYRLNSRGEIPFKDDAIRLLVSNAIQKLDPKDVVVIGVEVLDTGAPANSAATFAQFGPIKVATDSELAFKLVGASALLFIGLLAIGLVMQARRSSSLRNEMNRLRLSRPEKLPKTQ
jgi:type III secretion protein J